FTGYLRDHLQDRGLTSAEANEAFAILCRPVTASVLAQEIVEFTAIASTARAHLPRGARMTSTQGRARMLLAPDLLERLHAHWQKWRFLSYHGYGRRQLPTLDHYIDRLAEETAGSDARHATVLPGGRAVQERRALLRRLHLDAPHQALFDIYPEVGAVK